MNNSWGTSQYVAPHAGALDPTLRANVSAIGTALTNNGATLPTYPQSSVLQPQNQPNYAQAAQQQGGSMVSYDPTKPLSPTNMPGNQAGAFTPSTYAQSQGIDPSSPIYAGVNAAHAALPVTPAAATPSANNGQYENYRAMYPGGVNDPRLAGFSNEDLYRSVGNNQGLDTALLNRDGWDVNRAAVNAMNTGSGYATRDDFWNNIGQRQATQDQLAKLFGAPTSTEGTGPLFDLYRQSLAK
jgi:hypothetical protein